MAEKKVEPLFHQYSDWTLFKTAFWVGIFWVVVYEYRDQIRWFLNH